MTFTDHQIACLAHLRSGARLVGVLVLVLAGSSHVHARDGFEKIHCGGDIVDALVGQRGDNRDPVAATEARHKDLHLKDLGASDYGAFSSITWAICDKEYLVLEDNRTGVIRDALELPNHSKGKPWFEGSCKRKGMLLQRSVVGIVRDQGGRDDLPAELAWEVDETAVKFVKLSTDDLLCQRAGSILEPR